MTSMSVWTFVYAAILFLFLLGVLAAFSPDLERKTSHEEPEKLRSSLEEVTSSSTSTSEAVMRYRQAMQRRDMTEIEQRRVRAFLES